MSASAPIDLSRFPCLRRLGDLTDPRWVGALFVALMASQALSYWLLGTGPAGRGVSEFIIILINLLALACAWAAFRRTEATAALFWLLFAASLLILLIPALLSLVTLIFHCALVSDSTWRVLWCLYGAPILMILFLPDVHRRARVKTEIFLDLFQVALVVGLSYWTFFYLPLRQMLPPRRSAAQPQHQQSAECFPAVRHLRAPALHSQPLNPLSAAPPRDLRARLRDRHLHRELD